MSEVIWLGVLLGIGAALSVGPIFVTIVQEAACRGFSSSFRVILGSACADLVLLLPALAFTWVIQAVAGARFWVALIGSGYFLYLGYVAARDARRLWQTAARPAGNVGWSFWKGVIGNLANPLSWTFWLATGAPTMQRSYLAGGWPGLVLFTVVWFVVASGVEALVAYLVARSGRAVGHRGLALFTGGAAATFLILAATLAVTTLPA